VGDLGFDCFTEIIQHLDVALIPLIGVELSMCHMNSDLRGRERSGRVRERVTCCLSLGTRTSSHGDGWRRCQWSFPTHSTNPNRWVCWWGWGARRTSCLEPSAPTSLYSAGVRGPPTIKGRAPPIRAQSRGRDRAVGLGHGEINPTTRSHALPFSLSRPRYVRETKNLLPLIYTSLSMPISMKFHPSSRLISFLSWTGTPPQGNACYRQPVG
jgi:hypothetical protein